MQNSCARFSIDRGLVSNSAESYFAAVIRHQPQTAIVTSSVAYRLEPCADGIGTCGYRIEKSATPRYGPVGLQTGSLL